jgi:putative phosphoesterase
MRIGLISDVHGNLPALEAALACLEQQEPDVIVCLGDVAVGPWPRETIARLRALGCPTILGNWDAWMADGTPPFGERAGDPRLLEMAAFWAAELRDDDVAFLRGLEPRLQLDAGGGGRVLLVHGSPRSCNEPILAETPVAEVEAMLARADARVVVAGHTHVQLVRRLPRTLVVNPGSVGLPFSQWPLGDGHVSPWAEHGLLELGDDGSLDLRLRRTPYDVDALLRFVRASGVPHAEWWSRSWGPF